MCWQYLSRRWWCCHDLTSEEELMTTFISHQCHQVSPNHNNDNIPCSINHIISCLLLCMSCVELGNGQLFIVTWWQQLWAEQLWSDTEHCHSHLATLTTQHCQPTNQPGHTNTQHYHLSLTIQRVIRHFSAFSLAENNVPKMVYMHIIFTTSVIHLGVVSIHGSFINNIYWYTYIQ